MKFGFGNIMTPVFEPAGPSWPQQVAQLFRGELPTVVSKAMPGTVPWWISLGLGTDDSVWGDGVF